MRSTKKQSTLSIFSNRIYASYKYCLGSNKMINLPIRFYNKLITNTIYLKWWLNILDIIIEKGKEPTLRKLRTIQLIEVDLQLIMRIYISDRNKERIESDDRVAKANYRSRPTYSIETAILKKRLIYDLRKLTRNPILHNMTDLEACYDRQLQNIASIL